jgi:type IV pilus assembly protein PilA
MKRTMHKGFTLIELLVVVAIIALLAATILSSLGSARSKAKDAKIQAQMSNMRAQAELYYSSNPGGYSLSMFTTSSTSNGLQELITAVDADNGSGTVTPQASSSSWAVLADMVSTTNKWCVDSNGASKVSTAIAGSGTGTDPYRCN